MKLKDCASAIWKDPVWSKVISVGIVAAVAAVYSLVSTSGRQWVFTELKLDRIQVVGWWALGLVVGGVTSWWIFRTRKPQTSMPTFKQIPVEDRKLGLEWRIVRDPSTWIDDHTVKRASPAHQASLLAGPFHLKKGCGADMALLMDQRSVQVSSRCPSCGDHTFKPEKFNAMMLRELTLSELQRLHRIGRSLSGTVVLESPEYWQYLRGASEED